MPRTRWLAASVCLALSGTVAAAQSPSRLDDPPRHWYGAASRAVDDLDGDGLADVMHVRSAGEQSIAGIFRYADTIQARRGRDGALLWERRFDEEASYWVARLATGRRLVVVSSNRTTGTSGPSRTGLRTVHLEAIRPDGSTAWSRDSDAHSVVTPLDMEDLTIDDVVGVLARGRGRNDALLTVASHGTSQFALIDAGTGALTSLGQPQTAASWDRSWLPGDLTGDGVDDYLTSGSTVAASSQDVLTAYDGARGSQVWSLTLPTPSSSVDELMAVPSITNDRKPDVIVSADGEVWAVNGRTGALLWRRAGSIAIALPRRGGSAIVAIASLADLDHPSSTMSAYDGGGRLLWRANTSIRFKGSGGVDTYAASAGDVNGDGIDDALLSTRQHRDGTTVAEDRVWIDGRRGTAHRAVRDAQPLHHAFDRAGDDTIALALQRGRLVATIDDGRTARQLLRFSVPALPGSLAAFGDTVRPELARLRSGSCPALVVDTFGDGDDATTYVIDVNSGALAWALVSGRTLPRLEHEPATTSGTARC